MSAGDYPPGYDGMWRNQPPGYSVSWEQGAPAPAAPELPDPAQVHNVEAEAALLGAMMIAENMIPIIAERVSADHFYEPVHARIFRTIVRLHEKGITPTPVYLRPIFQNDPDLKQLGGPGYLAVLTGSNSGVIGARDFADQIAELAARRMAGAAAKQALERLVCFDADEDTSIEDVMADLQDAALTATTLTTSIRATSSAGMVQRVRERQHEIATSGDTPGIECKSIDDLNRIIGRAEPKTMTVIGGRPGSGKSTLAASAAWGYASAGDPVDFFHGEMSRDQMAMRHVSDLSHAMGMGIEHKFIREGKLDERQLRILAEVEKVSALIPLTFHATGPCHIKRVISGMTRSAKLWKNRGKTLRAAFVDYLQLYTADDSRGRPLQPGTTECVSAVSKALLAAAHRLDLALFVLSALGRQVEERKDKRPQMSDLKQSGDIEQDADNVLLVFREEIYLLKDKPRADPMSKEFQAWETDFNAVRGTMEIIGDKTRHGKPRTRKVKFFGSHYAVRGGGHAELDEPLLSPQLFEEEEPGWK